MEQRSNEPSAHRLREGRAQGVVARSPSLTAAIGLLAGLWAFEAQGPALLNQWMTQIVSPRPYQQVAHANPETFVTLVRSTAMGILMPLSIVFGAMVVGSWVAHQVQVGGLFSPAWAWPVPSRLFRRRGGASSASERATDLLLTAVLAVVLGGLVWWTVQNRLDPVERAADGPAGLFAASIGLVRDVVARTAWILLSFGVFDYLLRYQRIMTRLSMTTEEQRDERRALEGDPAWRNRRRAARDRTVEHVHALRDSEPI